MALEAYNTASDSILAVCKSKQVEQESEQNKKLHISNMQAKLANLLVLDWGQV